MSQASREATLQRIQSGLERLAKAIDALPENSADRPTDAWVSRQSYETLEAAHTLLRSRTQAAIEGIDVLLRHGSDD